MLPYPSSSDAVGSHEHSSPSAPATCEIDVQQSDLPLRLEARPVGTTPSGFVVFLQLLLLYLLFKWRKLLQNRRVPMLIEVIALRYAGSGDSGIYKGFTIFGMRGQGGYFAKTAPGERVKHAQGSRVIPFPSSPSITSRASRPHAIPPGTMTIYRRAPLA